MNELEKAQANEVRAEATYEAAKATLSQAEDAWKEVRTGNKAEAALAWEAYEAAKAALTRAAYEAAKVALSRAENAYQAEEDKEAK